MKLDTTKFGIVIVYSYFAVLLLAFIAGKLGFETYKVGYGMLILIVGVAIALIAAGLRDFKFETKEIFFFILVMSILFGTFFFIKNYIPEIFAIIPDSTKNLFSFLK